jgi:hypothetical protein
MSLRERWCEGSIKNTAKVGGMEKFMHLLTIHRFAIHLPPDAAKAEASNPLVTT